MSCEEEERAAAAAWGALSGGRAQCEAIGRGGGSPGEVQACYALLGPLQEAAGRAAAALRECREAAEAFATLGAEGLVTFLRVHEPGGGFGGGTTNWIDVDVVFKLDTLPDKGFGFQLRDDEFRPVREGMLSLLREAIAHELRVRTDYDEFLLPPNQNSVATRVALVRPSPTGPEDTRPEIFA